MRSATMASLVAALALAVGPAASGEQQAESMEQRILSRSVVDMGDTSRLQRVMAKARRGEQITVGVIGGSITQGASASTPDKRYGNLVARWWTETFPKAKVEFVNAGIGATGSHYGCLRYLRDLGSRKPDFVVVEFAVNDPNEQKHAETYEGALRQILSQPNSPAVMLLFTMHNNGSNSQERQAALGKHYGLPMVSFRDAVWPEIAAGSLKWEDVEADIVHPNDRGHSYMAQFITSVLSKVAAMHQPARLPKLKPVPKPLLTDLFERTVLLEGDGLKPVANTGWELATECGRRGWRSDRPGSTIEFEITGRVVLMTELHLNGPMGKARVQVDDLPAEVIDAWFDQTWGGWASMHVLARDLAPGRHRVRIELLEERNPKSAGSKFVVYAIGAAGRELQ